MCDLEALSQHQVFPVHPTQISERHVFYRELEAAPQEKCALTGPREKTLTSDSVNSKDAREPGEVS